MKILLVGEYSNVHWTLAEGLRALGHDVTVVSDGDSWKNYPRDIDLRRRDLDAPSRIKRLGGTLRYLGDLARVWPTLRGYDIVQLINPVFLDLRAERLWPFYRFLRRHNGRIFLGAFGIDHYWVKVGMDCKTFRYSDFNFGSQLRDYPFMHTMIADWLHGPKGDLNRRIADDCDGIITGLYEYEMCYRPFFPDKTRFIPFPINRSTITPATTLSPASPLRFFIGIQRSRSAYKGTDIMLSALNHLQADFGADRVQILKAESVPFAEYQEMMNSSHILLDQLYSYTPAMNALLAMAKGLIVVGGGEEEQYELLGEHELRPIINVQPTEQDVYDQILHRLVEHPEAVPQLQRDSIEYIRRHHDHIQVAGKYLETWQS
ncbi:MAG: glycosyltransferase family 1 protein [Bacteroidaceae bacterium]|nr:glycosyltransferase family 1 protein [Bacteroidaceae bacterium]